MPKEQFQTFGLGRATLRGIKKCPKCGTANGTRGTSCKNKSCDVVFKESGGRKKFSMEACRLNTGTSTRVNRSILQLLNTATVFWYCLALTYLFSLRCIRLEFAIKVQITEVLFSYLLLSHHL